MDSPAVRRVIDRAIRQSAADVYPPEAVHAWADGGSEEKVGRMITTTDAFVATVDGAVVGWANLDAEEVGQLYVDPDVGGRGVARRLYEAVEGLACARGLTRVTAVASLRAEPAFRRFGFLELARDDRQFNGHSFRVAHMAKCLDSRLRR